MAPGTPDSITARLIENAGFPAIYMAGFGATASHIGTLVGRRCVHPLVNSPTRKIILRHAGVNCINQKMRNSI